MPRRADGVWTDAQGNPLYYTDPNDPKFRSAPEMEFRDGRWVNKATGTPSLMRDDFPRESAPGSRQWQWPDGTPVQDKDLAEISHQAAGNPPSPGATDYGAHGSYDLTGTLDNLLTGGAPGAELDATQANEMRQRQQAYLDALTQQSQTGGGAWEQALKASTAQARDSAMALGQSTPGTEPMAAMRGIQNAQAGVLQRGAATADELRQRTRQAAQTELDATLRAQGATDAQQAAQQAAARQARREANAAIYEQAAQRNQGILSGVAQAGAAVAGAMSRGGPVPGVPERAGDSPENDTVPAWLSPGEVVIPRSVVAGGPEAAAEFVRAIQEQHQGARGYDVGGVVGGGGLGPGMLSPGRPAPAPRPAPSPASGPTVGGPTGLGQTPVAPPDSATATVGGGALGPGSLSPGRPASDAATTPAPQDEPTSTSDPNDPTYHGQTSGLFGFGAPQYAVDVEHGGLLETGAYDASRAAGMTNADELLRAYQGRGPSLAGGQLRTGLDDTLAAAMAAQAGLRGAGRAAGVGSVQNAAGAELARDAAQAGGTTAEEAMRAGRAYAQSTQRQRQQDLALALAKQQAAWKNSMLNAGIGIANQNQILGLLGGAGQAFSGFADLLSKGGDDEGGLNWTWDEAEGDAGGGVEWDGVDGAADGGLITDGGVLPPGYVGDILPGGTREEEALFGPLEARRLVPPQQPAAAPAVDPLEGGMTEGPPQALVSRSPELVSRMPDQRPIGARSAPDSADKTVMQTQGAATPRAKPAAPKADYLGQERTAAMEMGALQAQQARATADAQAAYVERVQQHQLEAADRQVRAQQAAEQHLSAIQQVREEMRAISTEVDPGRWWATRSTPGKVAAAIGLALGAVGAGKDGVNRAVGIIEGAVARDLEAQRASHELALRKGQQDLGAAQSIYALHRQLTQDEAAAADSAKATAYELARSQVDLAAARIGEPLAKQQALMLSAQLGQKAQQLDDAAKQRSFDNYIKSEDMKNRRIAAMPKQEVREKPADYGHDFAAPGYHVIPGAKPSGEELKKWRDGLAEKHNADIAITKLKSLIDQSWMLPGQEATARAQSLIADLKVGYKNMAALGALSGSDYALLEAEIPDPTTFRGHLVDDETLKSRLEQFVESAEMKFQNRAKVLGIAKDETQTPDASAAVEWLRANPSSPDAPAVRAKLKAMGAM